MTQLSDILQRAIAGSRASGLKAGQREKLLRWIDAEASGDVGHRHLVETTLRALGSIPRGLETGRPAIAANNHLSEFSSELPEGPIPPSELDRLRSVVEGSASNDPGRDTA